MTEPLATAWLDGAFVPLREARISPLDRGFLFADGVYEVIPVYAGRPFRVDAHCARLSRSLAEIRIEGAPDAQALRSLCGQLIARNGGGDLYIYLQVTRGMEFGRNHAPLPRVTPTVFAFCAPWPATSSATLQTGIACITREDLRWGRCDIKSIGLLPNVLARQEAIDAGAQETLLLRAGELTEASASTAHVVHDGVVLTPPNSHHLLPGTTRSVVEELLESLGIVHRSASVPAALLSSAQEIWLSAATREVSPVTRLDGRNVGDGVPGPIWRRVHAALQDYKLRVASNPW